MYFRCTATHDFTNFSKSPSMHGFGSLLFHRFSLSLYIFFFSFFPSLSLFLFFSFSLNFRTLFNIFLRFFRYDFHSFDLRRVSPLALSSFNSNLASFIIPINKWTLNLPKHWPQTLSSTLQSCISFTHTMALVFGQSRKQNQCQQQCSLSHSGWNRTTAKYDVLSSMLFDGIV